jgi:MoaA/NifB/PqqE/SkfB family radical SAM enzyme
MCTVKDSKSFNLPVDLKKEYLQELKSSDCSSPELVVCFLKGEPLLNLDEFCDLLEFSRKIGYNNILVTNGSLLNSENAERLLQSGLNNIRVSLDSHKEETYRLFLNNFYYSQVIGNIKNLVELKARNRCDVSVGVNIVVNALNIDHIESTIAYCENVLGVDLVNLLFMDRMIVGDAKKEFFHKYFLKDIPLLEELLHRCKNRISINITDNEIEYILEYHRRINTNIRDISIRCELCEYNSVLDTESYFQFCYLGGGRQMYIKPGDLKNFILPKLNHMRDLVRKCKCNDYCFIIGYNSIKVFENGVKRERND